MASQAQENVRIVATEAVWQSASMSNTTQTPSREAYLVIDTQLHKGDNAQSPDMAWEKYRDQLAQLHASTDREAERQRMAWGAYQQLLAQNHADLYRSLIKSDDSAVPPKAVQSACARGLKLVPEHGGDGLTEGAKARARSMAAGNAVSAANIRRMKAYFARHTEAKTANPPSPGYVAWLLWGGDAGKTWADAQSENVEKSVMKGGEGTRGGQVIGHTASGKPIYSDQAPHKYANFSREDHFDAADAHEKHATDNFLENLHQKNQNGPKAKKMSRASAASHSLRMQHIEAAANAVQKSAKPLGAAFSHARKVAKKKGKAGNRKVEHAAAQRYLTTHGHGKMEKK